MILAIETSTMQGSIALVKNGEVIDSVCISSESHASVSLVPSIQAMVKNAGIRLSDIRTYAVTSGPGSFTGLRVGLTAAKTFAYFNKSLVVAIPTLDALVVPATPSENVIVGILDARKGEVYGAVYDGSKQIQRITPYRVCPIEDILTGHHPVTVIGNAVAVYRQRILDCAGSDVVFTTEDMWIPKATSVARLVETGQYPEYSGEQLFKLAPMYIRKSEAEIKWGTR